jgi:hypothetical protein
MTISSLIVTYHKATDLAYHQYHQIQIPIGKMLVCCKCVIGITSLLYINGINFSGMCNKTHSIVEVLCIFIILRHSMHKIM